MCDCTGDDCACFDKPCCSLRSKAIFFASWIAVHHIAGILLMFCVIYSVPTVDNQYVKLSPEAVKAVYYLTLAYRILLTGFWICMFYGIFKENGKVFLVGLIGSWLILFAQPMILFFQCLVVQIIFTIISCRYYNFELKK